MNTTTFYVYAYVRNKDSATAKAGTPYYIGKGSKNRINEKHTSAKIPKDAGYIVIMENNLTELGAFAIERRMIAWYGRKNSKTGILVNLTDGGEGTSGHRHTNTTKEKIAEASKNRVFPPMSTEQKKKLSDINIGKKLSDATKEKMSASRKGIKKPWLSNRPRTEKELANLNRMTEASKLKITVNGVIYTSVRDGARAIGIHEETLRYRCRSNGFPECSIIGEQDVTN
jgi:hypothetical protein